jgi:hypothetical protein
MSYIWEPALAPYYDDSILADYAFGEHYDVIQVELGNDGWHGMILAWEDSVPGPYGVEGSAVLLDEAVFSERVKAREWAEGRDWMAYSADLEDDDLDYAMWSALADDEDDEDEFGL